LLVHHEGVMSPSIPLSDAAIEAILQRTPRLTIGVVGDLFLDRYLDLDGSLTEPSLETGLDAYQVVRVRSAPGAAGTVLNNLVALDVGRVCPVAALGDDGEGYELRRALAGLGGVDLTGVLTAPSWRTPTYTKPMLRLPGQPARELNRLDIQNRTPIAPAVEARVLDALRNLWGQVDALLVLDQVVMPECGVVTAGVRRALAELAAGDPGRFALADSRARVGLFRGVALKPNERECLAAVGGGEAADTHAAVAELARAAGRPVFCTRGERGTLVCDAAGGAPRVDEVPAFPVRGPIDAVGAGDSTSAAIACAVAAGRSLVEAAAFGNLVASITIKQLGTTGTATPEQVRRRWREVAGR
jgi:bifunctional ADP-heptose synthase (sugar kinase/adenylyltransferase)